MALLVGPRGTNAVQIPAGTTAGMGLTAILGSSAGTTAAAMAAAGWTLRQQLGTNNSGGFRLWILTRVAQAGDAGTTVTFTPTNGGAYDGVIVAAPEGVLVGTVSGLDAAVTNARTLDMSSLTPSVAGTAIYIVGQRNLATTTPDAGWTEDVDSIVTLHLWAAHNDLNAGESPGAPTLTTTVGGGGSIAAKAGIVWRGIDTTGPALAITAPANGATVSGAAVAVTATATDPAGIDPAGVTFKADGVTFGTDASSPYAATLDTTGLADGEHTIRIEAQDTLGNPSFAEITVTVLNDTEGPEVAITEPPNVYARLFGVVPLEATAADESGIASVTFEVDGIPVGAPDVAGPPWTGALDTSTLADGPHTLVAIAEDEAGNITATAGQAFATGDYGAGDYTVASGIVMLGESLEPAVDPAALRLGPLAFPAPLERLTESLGDGLEAVGAALVAAERRPRPFPLRLAVHGDYANPADPRAAGLRLRRQVRQLLDNARWRAHGLLFHFPPDPELATWLLVGGGDLEETDPGISFGEFELELTDCYFRGRPGTHRTARRLELADRRTGLVPRDTRGLLYSTDFAELELPTHPAILPGDVVNVNGAGGAPPASSIPGPVVDARRLYRAYAAADGEVLSYLPNVLAIPSTPAELELDTPGSVRVWDQRQSTTFAEGATTPAGDRTPELYGLERIYGPVLDASPALTADNGLCRLVWLGPGPHQGLALEVWDAIADRYVRHGRVLHASTVLEVLVLELTAERCVLEWRAADSTMRAILQRGWYGPRLEVYRPAGAAALHVALEGAGAGAAGAHESVTAVTVGTFRITGAASHGAVAWTNGAGAGAPLNDPAGRWATPGEALAVQTTLGSDGPEDLELASLGLVDAQSVPVLLARGG